MLPPSLPAILAAHAEWLVDSNRGQYANLAGANLSARPGYPTITVPFGFYGLNPTPPWPDGFEAPRSPFAVSFAAGACSEPRLVALAYAFEQITQRRVAPPR